MQPIQIYTDGGCRGNPGMGAWAFVVLNGNSSTEMSGQQRQTTNNRMELTAVINALSWAAEHNLDQTVLTLYTDSQYVKKGITEWIKNWLKNGWQTAAKQPVKNQDLWQKLHKLDQLLKIDWQWLKGHSTNAWNNLCDSLVQQAMQGY